MKKACTTLSLILMAVAASEAATINSTLTVNATGSIGATGITASGPITLSGVGSGTFTATAPLSLTSQTITADFTATLSGGTLIGKLSFPFALLSNNPPAGTTASATITSGTGSFAGYTGNFPTLSGSGNLNVTSFTLTNVTGNGTINTGGSTGGGGTGTSTPTITAVQNNYSYILPGLPNYGISPGTLFIIKGSNFSNQPLSALQSSAAPGLPKTLNGTSVSVTVNGTTVTPAIYYTSPTQLGVVLPSNAPVGTGTITVTNGSTAGTPAPIQVVQSALGLDTLFGSGTGGGVATDASGNVLTASSSASPGQTIILWGSGIGADTSNADTTYPESQNDLTAKVGLKVYIGGIQANIAYAGRSQYPGVDQVDVTVPTGVTPGCSVSVVAAGGTPLVVSNSVTIPVAPNGGACSDAIFGIGGTQAGNLGGKSSVNLGVVDVTQIVTAGATSTAPTSTTNAAGAIFQNVSGSQFATNAGTGASIGSCVVNAPTVGTATIPTITGLDAGSLSVNGPTGSVALSVLPTQLGLYFGQLSTGAIPSSGGAFTFTGTGGKTVGAFTTTLNFPAPLVWTNMSSITSVNRSQGVTVNWTGGGTGTYVSITGSSSATINGQFTLVGFTCSAPVSAGTFTVPPPVLLALPAGNGSLSVGNSTNPQTFTASGLDIGYAFAGTTLSNSPTYN